MKLTKEEIKFIDNYLIKNEVKYWDVRLELLDHIVSAVEDKMTHGGISFNEALLEVHHGFGNRIHNGYTYNLDFNKALFIDDKGFKKFTLQKQKEISRKHRVNYRKTLVSFLISKPFILEFLILLLVVYTLYQFNPKIAFLAVMIVCLMLEVLKICIGSFEKANRKSLNMQMAMTTGTLFMSLNYFVITGFNNYYEDLVTKPYLIIIAFYLLLFPFLRHGLNCYRVLLKENKKDYNLLIS